MPYKVHIALRAKLELSDEDAATDDDVYRCVNAFTALELANLIEADEDSTLTIESVERDPTVARVKSLALSLSGLRPARDSDDETKALYAKICHLVADLVIPVTEQETFRENLGFDPNDMAPELADEMENKRGV